MAAPHARKGGVHRVRLTEKVRSGPSHTTKLTRTTILFGVSTAVGASGPHEGTARSTLAISVTRLVVVLTVLGCRLPRVSCSPSSASRSSGSAAAKSPLRTRMPLAERLAPPLQRLAAQRLSSGEVALGLQQQAEVADGV
eukprot:scaffold2471_cov63-Phaeocystis_antarctica.AAC.6